MNARIERKPGPVKNCTTVERTSDREVVLHDSSPSKEALDAAGTRAAHAMLELQQQTAVLRVHPYHTDELEASCGCRRYEPGLSRPDTS